MMGLGDGVTARGTVMKWVGGGFLSIRQYSGLIWPRSSPSYSIRSIHTGASRPRGDLSQVTRQTGSGRAYVGPDILASGEKVK